MIRYRMIARTRFAADGICRPGKEQNKIFLSLPHVRLEFLNFRYPGGVIFGTNKGDQLNGRTDLRIFDRLQKQREPAITAI